MKSQVFLSYSSRDRQFATALRRALKKLNVSTFDPEVEMKAGADWRKTVLDGIRQTQLALVLLREPSLAGIDWISYEVGTANALGKDIIVMKPAAFSAQDLPSDLSGWRMLDLDPSSPEKTAKILVSSLAVAS